MINVTIYLKKEQNPKELIQLLLKDKLIASASIDKNNISYNLMEDILSEEAYDVITALSKASLFNAIVAAVEKKLGKKLILTPLQLLVPTDFLIIP
ncbi:hypothetical protein [Flavobacterium frigoris]|uniref:Uncharacterized protein n=1 Tax=Flavobacterium frigoris (strain PS1) TaxID=1086011 RepID=H7FUJ5_FLAFP|nr:hypothetical protein [Flavobacterium frigoris]EIA07942.1 hypothetical protein HJ01_02810 [Flavobacterium frigoris PS1]